MISVSPLSGNIFSTIFSVTLSPSTENFLVDWNDGTFTTSCTSSHSYSKKGQYKITYGTCTSTSSTYLSVYNYPFFEDTISTFSPTYSSLESEYSLYTINLSSLNAINTINLYASGSNSIPYKSERTFWSHLNPEWSFYNTSYEPITSLTLTGNPVLSGDYTLGYSSSAEIYYKDDLPGNPILWFTLDKDYNNSRIYSAHVHTISAQIPTKLKISADGINEINALQWSNNNVPFLISVANDSVNIIHSASGYFLNYNIVQNCNGISDTNQYIASSVNIELYDNNDFPIGGYAFGNFFLPSSSLDTNTILSNEINCGENPDEALLSKNRNIPIITLSASGNFITNNISYPLSGTSTSFSIHKFEDFYNIKLKNENKTTYDIIKKFNHFNLDNLSIFNNMLSAIASKDGLDCYSKIQNLTLESDLDLCSIQSLKSFAQKLDNQLDTFNISFPSELDKIVNMFSIPLQKLIGERQIKLEMDELINPDDYVDSNSTIILSEKNSNDLSFEYYNTSRDQLKNIIDTNKYCAHTIKISTKNPSESFIDYNNCLLGTGLSAHGDFYNDNGIVEEKINFLLNSILLQ